MLRRVFLTGSNKTFVAAPEEVPIVASNLTASGMSRLVRRRGGRVRTRADRRSLDDMKLFGRCVFNMSMRQATEQNLTVPLKLIALDRAEACAALEAAGVTDRFNIRQARVFTPLLTPLPAPLFPPPLPRIGRQGASPGVLCPAAGRPIPL